MWGGGGVSRNTIGVQHTIGIDMPYIPDFTCLNIAVCHFESIKNSKKSVFP